MDLRCYESKEFSPPYTAFIIGIEYKLRYVFSDNIQRA